MTPNQNELLKEVLERDRLVCLHALDQPLVNDLVAIIKAQAVNIEQLTIKLNEKGERDL